MYLNDHRLRELLGEIRFEASTSEQAFDPDAQIQPCSVDLRLCSVFWVPQSRRGRRRRISLKRSKLLELQPRRFWRKLILERGQTHVLRPGDMILGRTCEEFSIPEKFAGKLEGRSSFARMGLLVHCSADFINPGYRGRMPLQLVNLGPHEIELVPYVPICQLMLIPLGDRPDRIYGDSALYSKYVDDDGGPSYWWRDKRVQSLHAKLQERDLSATFQDEVLTLLSGLEPEVLQRCEEFIAISPVERFTNVDEFIRDFALAEQKKHRWWRVKHAAVGFSIFSFIVALTLGASRFMTDPDSLTRAVVLGAVVAVSYAAWAVWQFLRDDADVEFLSPKRADVILTARADSRGRTAQ